MLLLHEIGIKLDSAKTIAIKPPPPALTMGTLERVSTMCRDGSEQRRGAPSSPRTRRDHDTQENKRHMGNGLWEKPEENKGRIQLYQQDPFSSNPTREM